jgi:tyrosyl-tRNA synthetase
MNNPKTVEEIIKLINEAEEKVLSISKDDFRNNPDMIKDIDGFEELRDYHRRMKLDYIIKIKDSNSDTLIFELKE